MSWNTCFVFICFMNWWQGSLSLETLSSELSAFIQKSPWFSWDENYIQIQRFRPTIRSHPTSLEVIAEATGSQLELVSYSGLEAYKLEVSLDCPFFTVVPSSNVEAILWTMCTLWGNTSGLDCVKERFRWEKISLGRGAHRSSMRFLLA